VARILGRIFHDIGVLGKGHLVEAERADLVGEYIGHTAQKTKEIVKKSKGGILFVDEAYTLAQGGEKILEKKRLLP
jgi:stage V sporulation protein K